MAHPDLHAELAAALPDLPRWVGPRGLLLMEPGEVYQPIVSAGDARAEVTAGLVEIDKLGL